MALELTLHNVRQAIQAIYYFEAAQTSVPWGLTPTLTHIHAAIQLRSKHRADQVNYIYVYINLHPKLYMNISAYIKQNWLYISNYGKNKYIYIYMYINMKWSHALVDNNVGKELTHSRCASEALHSTLRPSKHPPAVAQTQRHALVNTKVDKEPTES